MEALLDRLSSTQIVAVICVLAGAAVAVSLIWAITKYQLQALAEGTALQRERQKADLALRERVLGGRLAAGDKVTAEELAAFGAGDPVPGDLDAELAKRFGLLDADPATIEQALRAAMSAAPARKQMIVAVMDNLLDYEAGADAVLAAVRPLCGAAAEHPAASAA